MQLNIYERCGSCLGSLPCQEKTLRLLAEQSPTAGSIGSCNLAEGTGLDCVTQVSSDFDNNKLDCWSLCRPACEDTTFLTQISAGRWPSKPYDYILKNKMASLGTNLDEDKFDVTMTTSFLRLHFYYKRLTVVTQSEEPPYNWSKLLGNIGGQLGLFLGCSLMTGVEILELLLDLGPCIWQAMSSRTRDRGASHKVRSNISPTAKQRRQET